MIRPRRAASMCRTAIRQRDGGGDVDPHDLFDLGAVQRRQGPSVPSTALLTSACSLPKRSTMSFTRAPSSSRSLRLKAM